MDNLILIKIDLSDFTQGNATLGNIALGNPWEFMCYCTMGIPIPDNLALSNVTLSDSMWGIFTMCILPWVKKLEMFLDVYNLSMGVKQCY